MEPAALSSTHPKKFFCQTACDLVQKEFENYIPFGCRALDSLVGRTGICGIQRGVITELVGFSGTGKTQLCIQLCASAILRGGKALFIDTKGGFSLDRFIEITSGQIFTFKTKGYKSVDTILGNLNLVYAPHMMQFEETINGLHETLTKEPAITLVAVDSFAFHLNAMRTLGNESSLRRTRMISTMLAKLMRAASRFNVAIVVTNSLMTKFQGQKSSFCASLGERFFLGVNQRIMCSRLGDDTFCATLDKSLYNPVRTVNYVIKESGAESIAT